MRSVIATTSAYPLTGSLDTTVRIKYTLASHPTLTTPDALAALLTPFGAVDTPSIVLSLKPPKKAPQKPPKFGVALVPFTQVGSAFAAVGASGRPERGLAAIDITWAEGQEPALVLWLRRMGQLGGTTSSTPVASDPGAAKADRVAAGSACATPHMVSEAAGSTFSFAGTSERTDSTGTPFASSTLR